MRQHGLGDLARARDSSAAAGGATEIGLVDCQHQALLGIAILKAEAGDAGTGARLLGRTKDLASRLGAANEDQDDALERQTLAGLKDALGTERLASELAAGAALSLKDAIDRARTELCGNARRVRPGPIAMTSARGWVPRCTDPLLLASAALPPPKGGEGRSCECR